MYEVEIATHFLDCLEHRREAKTPYRHFLLHGVLPDFLRADIAALPVAPPLITDTQGRRETHNSTRLFFGETEQKKYQPCRDLANALQNPGIVRRLEQVCGARLRGTSLRIEYCLDTDGFWLEPHTDIGAKRFTMLIYLNSAPAGEDWGTDIYTPAKSWAGSAPGGCNNGLIFIPGSDTWHGFRRRQITGVRRSLIVNYVGPEWRARHELAFPDEPVA